ncbi:cellulase family glycosylhydrolase, partial [bacterium]|nr:cellulase family glycosylhydrolase [bacterium]
PLCEGVQAVFDEKGVWRLEGKQGVLLGDCGLRLWTRGGFLRQTNARVTAPPADTPTGRTFEGSLGAGALRIRYWQTATPVPKGLLVQYAIAAPSLTDKEEVAAGFDLPIAVFGGGHGWTSLDDRKPFPQTKGAEPYIVDAEAAGLHLLNGKLRLSLQRRPGGKIIVQDGRHWGNDTYQAHVYAVRAPDDAEGWLSLSFLLSVGPPAQGPVIAAVAPGRSRVPCGETHETEVVLWAPYQNAFLPGQVRAWGTVTAPSGKAVRVGAFYARDFTRSRQRGTERLDPVGHGTWRVRYTPSEVGAHQVVVHAASGGKTAASAPMAFEAIRATGQRFLHASRGRWLHTAAGAPVILVGYNTCWPESQAPTYEMEGVLDGMARDGLNATRLWLCSWGIGIEGQRPDAYRLADAWRLDALLRRARERGIYVQLCLDNLADLASEKRAATNPYLAANGGPCRTPEAFFTSPRARAQHRRRLAYLVARYGSYTSVLAWELCNELDYAAGGRQDAALLAWARETAQAVKASDPYGHPVTVGLGPRSSWRALWALDAVDVVQAHSYIRKPLELHPATELDAAALILQRTDEHAKGGKPLLITEFGFLGTRDFNPLNEADRTGVHLHNAIWASALGGSAGAAMAWWWDTSVREHNLAYHYAALAKFLAGGPGPTEAWQPIRDAGNGDIRVVGLRGPSAALVWVQHRDNRWHRRVVQRKNAPALGSRTVPLADLQ